MVADGRASTVTIVQDKAIALLTDARLYHMARATLVRQAKKCGLELGQSYERLSKRELMMNGRYAHARQMNRARRMQKRLRTEGDAMNAVLCGAGHNLLKILRRLALFWLRILLSGMRSFNLRIPVSAIA